jgi:hypothetical protein
MGAMLHWILPRLAAYVAVVVAAGLLFLAGASVYALMWPPSRCSPPTVAPRRRRSGINLQRPSPAASALGGNHKRAARGPQNPGSPAPAARWPGSPGPNLLSPPSGCRRGGAALPRQYRGPTQTRLGTLRASWSLLAAAAGASVKYSRATSTEGAEVHFIDLKDRQG